MAVARDTLTRGREAEAGEMLEKIDCGDRIAMDVKDKSHFGAESYTGNIPFWRVNLNAVGTPDQGDAAAEPLVLAELDQMRFKLSKRTKPMPYTWRSTARDELHFIQQGHARFLTELGEIEGVPGRFIYIARGVRYRVVPTDGALFDFILESEAALRPSEHWQTVDLKVTRPRFPLAAEPQPAGGTLGGADQRLRLVGHGQARLRSAAREGGRRPPRTRLRRRHGQYPERRARHAPAAAAVHQRGARPRHQQAGRGRGPAVLSPQQRAQRNPLRPLRQRRSGDRARLHRGAGRHALLHALRNRAQLRPAPGHAGRRCCSRPRARFT